MHLFLIPTFKKLSCDSIEPQAESTAAAAEAVPVNMDLNMNTGQICG